MLDRSIVWASMNKPRLPASRFAFASVVLALAAGCASYGPSSLRVGQSADEATRQMGVPTARYARTDGGSRLEFARGPFGKHTYMVDVDADGRVRAELALNVRGVIDSPVPGARAAREFEASDQRRFFVPCPHCGAMQWLNRLLGFDETDGLTAPAPGWT